MAVIQYKDKYGNVRTVNSIKGDKGPRGPVGPKGPTGPTGPKGGACIKGSYETLEELKDATPYIELEIGDGYIITNEEAIYTWDGKNWIKVSSLVPVNLNDLDNVLITTSTLRDKDVLVYNAELGKWVNDVVISSGGGSTGVTGATGPIGDGSAYTKSSITVSLKDGLGGYREGDIIRAGTSFDTFVQDLLNPPIAPTYTEPTLDISINTPIVSRGESINPTILVKYKQNDAGNIRHIYLFKGDSKLDTFNAISENIFPGMTVVNEDITYTLEVYYEEGHVKVNSNNLPDYHGQIARGVIKQSVTVKCGIPYWGFASTKITPPRPMDVINTVQTGYNLEDSIEINSNEETRSIQFLYPASLGEAKEIHHVGFDPNSIDIFDKSTIQIYSKNYADPMDYYLYQYNAPIEIGKARFVLIL